MRKILILFLLGCFLCASNANYAAQREQFYEHVNKVQSICIDRTRGLYVVLNLTQHAKDVNNEIKSMVKNEITKEISSLIIDHFKRYGIDFVDHDPKACKGGTDRGSYVMMCKDALTGSVSVLVNKQYELFSDLQHDPDHLEEYVVGQCLFFSNLFVKEILGETE